MPCRMDGYGPSPYEIHSHEALPLLCTVLKYLSASKRAELIKEIEGLGTWWKVEKKRDKEQREDEREDMRHKRARASALAKLTQEEREALR